MAQGKVIVKRLAASVDAGGRPSERVLLLACVNSAPESGIRSPLDAALAAVVEQTDVFARVSPAQKNRLIRALKRNRHVVGYLGDGINDAPARRRRRHLGLGRRGRS
jgi:haloacid dehalogenase-like hydrolase